MTFVKEPTRSTPPVVLMFCFARSGGTLLNQCLASLGGVKVLSEVNPLGGGQGYEGPESPATVRAQAKEWFNTDVGTDDFAEGVRALNDRLAQRGERLVLRDWSFVNFVPHDLNQNNPPNRFLTLDELRNTCELRTFGFVRDGIDVWISRDMLPISAFAAEYLEYVKALLQSGARIFKYEDFCTAPKVVFREICEHCDLPYSEDFVQRYKDVTTVNGDVQVVGGSRGHRQREVRLLPRKALPRKVIAEINSSWDLRKANRMLGYPEEYGGNPLRERGLAGVARRLKVSLRVLKRSISR